MRHIIYGIAVFLAFAAGGFVLRRAEAAPPLSPTAQVGRWQIAQGPPTGMFRTYLLDTATGESFIVCDLTDGGVKREGWCGLRRQTIGGTLHAGDIEVLNRAAMVR